MSGEAAIGGCLAIIVAVIGLSALSGLALMLLVGALHSEFGWLRPIGYLPSWGISFALGIVFGRFRATTTA